MVAATNDDSMTNYNDITSRFLVNYANKMMDLEKCVNEIGDVWPHKTMDANSPGMSRLAATNAYMMY